MSDLTRYSVIPDKFRRGNVLLWGSGWQMEKMQFL